ncbi:MAG: succinylglutamate desuccinylase/aspartoacylase family protein [Planctomycetota bacterium]
MSEASGDIVFIRNSANHDPAEWCGVRVEPGSSAAMNLTLSESYSSQPVTAPVHVWRGEEPGPAVALTAAVHGDEINGTGVIRRILREKPFQLKAGTLVMVPVVNMLGFERHARYLPDRRDLNRSFPGSKDGSLAGRLAHSFFQAITKRCDYGIDLHTAAVRRTNFSNVRADMSDARLAAFARAFGAELIVDGKGPKGSLRQSACRVGCATLILEAGEVWKVEPAVGAYALHGIKNCLRYLGMTEGKPLEPPYRIETDTTKWVRAEYGGFLEFHIAPGQIVEKGEALATNTNIAGDEQNTIYAPRSGVILGMTTMPSVAPGDPICHIAFSKKGALVKAGRVVEGLSADTIHARVRGDLASSVAVTEYDGAGQQAEESAEQSAGQALTGGGTGSG